MPFEYEYEFVEYWCHEITFIGRASATSNFVCTIGEGHGCAENGSSCRSRQKLKEAYRANRPTKNQTEEMCCYEWQASNAEEVAGR